MGKYYIDNKEFSSLKKIKDYTRNKLKEIYNNSDREIVYIEKNDSSFLFLYKILEKHKWKEEKIGCGIKRFYIKRNFLNKKGLEINLERIDGSKIDFSWIKCVTGKFTNIKQDLITAMREAINEQTRRFRSNNKLICQLCKCISGNFHVDHDSPSFKILSDNFLIKNPKHPKSFCEDKDIHWKKFLEEDEQFKQKWQEYHKKNATLQILCQQCNLRKSKK